MAKDKVIGLVIMIVGILMAVIYTLGSVVDLYLETLGNTVGGIDLTGPLIGIDIFPAYRGL